MDKITNEWLGEQIKSIRDGNSGAISAIYETVGKVMFAVAGIYLSDRADIEEVVQESLMIIVRKAQKFRENKNAYAWIMKIVENTAKNKIAYNNKRKTVSLEEVRTYSEISDDGLLFYDVLGQLKDNERKVIYYIFWCGLTLTETAKVLGKPKSSTKYLLDKTLEKIKDFLES